MLTCLVGSVLVGHERMLIYFSAVHGKEKSMDYPVWSNQIIILMASAVIFKRRQTRSTGKIWGKLSL